MSEFMQRIPVGNRNESFVFLASDDELTKQNSHKASFLLLLLHHVLPSNNKQTHDARRYKRHRSREEKDTIVSDSRGDVVPFLPRYSVVVCCLFDPQGLPS